MFMALLPAGRSVLPSCPRLSRASTSFASYQEGKTWMAGTSPAMTTRERNLSIWSALSREAALFQVWISPVLDRHLRTDPLQLQCQRPVVGARRLVLRIELDGGTEIGKRAGPVALFVPEFTTGVENIRQRRVEPQRRVVVADGAVDHVLAAVGAGARDQRLDAVGSQRLVVVDQRAADGNDLVGVIGGRCGDARRGIDLRIGDRLVAGCAGVVRRRCPQDRRERHAPDQA